MRFLSVFPLCRKTMQNYTYFSDWQIFFPLCRFFRQMQRVILQKNICLGSIFAAFPFFAVMRFVTSANFFCHIWKKL